MAYSLWYWRRYLQLEMNSQRFTIILWGKKCKKNHCNWISTDKNLPSFLRRKVWIFSRKTMQFRVKLVTSNFKEHKISLIFIQLSTDWQWISRHKSNFKCYLLQNFELKKKIKLISLWIKVGMTENVILQILFSFSDVFCR